LYDRSTLTYQLEHGRFGRQFKHSCCSIVANINRNRTTLFKVNSTALHAYVSPEMDALLAGVQCKQRRSDTNACWVCSRTLSSKVESNINLFRYKCISNND